MFRYTMHIQGPNLKYTFEPLQGRYALEIHSGSILYIQWYGVERRRQWYRQWQWPATPNQTCALNAKLSPNWEVAQVRAHWNQCWAPARAIDEKICPYGPEAPGFGAPPARGVWQVFVWSGRRRPDRPWRAPRCPRDRPRSSNRSRRHRNDPRRSLEAICVYNIKQYLTDNSCQLHTVC